jgi:hypothetical protein
LDIPPVPPIITVGLDIPPPPPGGNGPPSGGSNPGGSNGGGGSGNPGITTGGNGNPNPDLAPRQDVPEPSTMMMFATALLAMAFVRRRRNLEAGALKTQMVRVRRV